MTNSAWLQDARIDPVAALLRGGFVIFVALLWIVCLTLAVRLRHLDGGSFGAGAVLAALLLTLSAAAYFCADLERRRRGEISVSTVRRFCPAALVPTVAAVFLFFPIFRYGAVFLLLIVALGLYALIWLLPVANERIYAGRWTKSCSTQTPESPGGAVFSAQTNADDLAPTSTESSPIDSATLLFDAPSGIASNGANDTVGVVSAKLDERPKTEFLPGLFTEPEALDSETIRIPVGAFDDSFDDVFSDSDETEPEISEEEPDESRLYFENRFRIDDGREQVEGWFRPHFEPRQEVCVVHLTFQPPFAAPPCLELFQLFGGQVTLNVGRIESFGARIEVKRRLPSGVMNDDVVADEFPDESVRIGFFATGAMTEPV